MKTILLNNSLVKNILKTLILSNHDMLPQVTHLHKLKIVAVFNFTYANKMQLV